jgi:HlyD family secretion protein
MSMDKEIIDNRRIKPKHLKIILPSVALLIVFLIIVFRDPTTVYKIEKDKITIDSVFKGPFLDFIHITGQVEPISIVSLEALEEGRVEKILIEEGNPVKKGDAILTLRNENLNMSFTDGKSSYAYLTNEMNNQLIEVKQQEIANKQELLNLDNDILDKQRKLEKTSRLYAKGGVSEEEYLVLKNSYETAVRNRALKLQKMQLDSELRNNKRNQIELKMKMVQQQLENLNVKSPVTGQLGTLDIEIGKSVVKGQPLGKINVLTSYKITALIDEHYIDRVRKDLQADIVRETDTFRLTVAKVYPQVNNGQFKVDLRFVSALPENIRAGQSYNISLQLGETEQAIQLPRGGFFQSTGGQWVFVLAPDESFAVKRNIRIGKQNPQNYEVLEGLRPGEKIITSNYDIFGNNEKIIFK